MATIDGATSFTQQVLAVWTDGKTSHAVRPAGTRIGGKGDEPRQDHLMPFQYQVPINKYSTLHSIAVKRSASANALASRQLNNDDQKTRVFATGTRVELDEMENSRPANSRHRLQVGSENELINWRKIEMVEQIGRQLDLLKDQDSEGAAAVIKVLREQMDSFEKESQQRHHHHHHHQQPSTQQQKPNHHGTDTETEDKGVQADWMLLQETEAELMINRPLERLSVPDLTKPRQRIGSKSHSVDDDDAAPAADDDGAKLASSTSAAEAEEELRLVNDRLVTARLREANLLAHLKDYRQRADDLRRVISLRDSQIERLEDEIARLKDALVEGRGKEKELQSFISDLQLTLDDLHSKYEEYVVLGQLRDSEHAQVVDDLEQQVARLKEEVAMQKHALTTYGQPALGYQSLQHLTKNAVHFQSTGCLAPAINASGQNPDKAMRGHRSVESSPSMRRCVRYKEAALAHDRNDPWDPDDDDSFNGPIPKQTGIYSSTSQSPNNTRRGILHDKAGDNSKTTTTTSSYNGRCIVDEADEDEENGDGATNRGVNDKDPRRGAVGSGARANIPLEGESEVPRTRALVRKASYICGIQQHSVLDDLTDSVD